MSTENKGGGKGQPARRHFKTWFVTHKCAFKHCDQCPKPHSCACTCHHKKAKAA